MALLSLKNVNAKYGFIHALKNINFEVEQGQIIAFLGANGAGKSTLLKIISGEKKGENGSNVVFNGLDITKKKIFTISKKGISISPEGRQVLVGLTVRENLKVGAFNLKAYSYKDENGKLIKVSKSEHTKANFKRVFKLFPILEERQSQQANTLSGGEQQMLVIARALMASPKLLLLDEPSLGLAPLIIKDIFNALKVIKEQGTTILLVEQNARMTLKLADYAYVLELGNITMQGTGKELLNNDDLISAYLGH